MSINLLALNLNLPQTFVDIRHASTHGQLPSLHTLRQSCRDAILWLEQRYWIARCSFIQSHQNSHSIDHPNNILELYLQSQFFPGQKSQFTTSFDLRIAARSSNVSDLVEHILNALCTPHFFAPLLARLPNDLGAMHSLWLPFMSTLSLLHSHHHLRLLEIILKRLASTIVDNSLSSLGEISSFHYPKGSSNIALFIAGLVRWASLLLDDYCAVDLDSARISQIVRILFLNVSEFTHAIGLSFMKQHVETNATFQPLIFHAFTALSCLAIPAYPKLKQISVPQGITMRREIHFLTNRQSGSNIQEVHGEAIWKTCSMLNWRQGLAMGHAPTSTRHRTEEDESAFSRHVI